MHEVPSISGRSASRKLCKVSFKAADHRWLARRSIKRLIRKHQQTRRMEAGRQPFQAHPGNFPVTVASGSLKKVHLPCYAFRIGRAQFREQGVVAACRCRKCFFECAGFISHFPRIVPKTLLRGLLRPGT